MLTNPKLLFAALVGFTLSVGLAAPPLLAQTAPATQITPSDDTGTKPFGTYFTGAGDVNLTNGNLSLNLPLVSLPGRNGHNFVLSIQYDSKIWTPSAVFNDSTDITYTWKAEERLPPVGDMGWRLSWPMLSDGAWAYDQAGNHVGSEDYIITMAGGAKHNLSARSTYMDAEDGSSLTIDSSNPNDILVKEKDGSVMHFPCCLMRGASKIEDSNGNFISLGMDTLGRPITTVYDSGDQNKLTSISYKDSNGATQTITLNYTQITLFQTSGPYQTPQPPFAYPAQNNCGLPGCLHIWVHQPPQGTYWFLTSVVLPNSTSYTFAYNGYGELTKITYPTGGYTAYVYGAFTHQETYWVATATNLPGDFREVTERHTCRDSSGPCGGGGTPEDITTFAPTIDSTKPNNSQIDVVDPLGYKNHYEFSEADTTYYARYSWPREQLHQIYSETGTLLRTIQTGYVYLDTFCFCPLYPANVVTTLNDTGGTALATQTQYTYDTFTATVMYPPYNPSPDYNVDYENQSVTYRSRPIDNPVQVLEYDYASGSPARKTVNTFLKVNPVNNVDYFAVHIRDRKTDTQVFDSGTTKFSETQYEYDNYPTSDPMTPSGAVQHDSFGPARGNLTAIKRWRNTDGAFLSVQYRYDDAGNATKMIDPLNHTTLMSYADTWGDASCVPIGGNSAAFLTSITDALSHVTSAKYNSCSGTIASLTDANGQVTNFGYDLLNRRTTTTPPPAGGQTTHCYSDIGGATCAQGPPPFSLTTTKKLDSSRSVVSQVLVDGLARVTQTRLTSDPDCSTGDRTDTTYDGLGRVHSVSNPYCSTSDPTYGLTTYAYDALNRTKQVTHPDSTSILTSYIGRATQVSDEGNPTQRVQRISQPDALGRLTSVCEVSSVSLIGSGGTPASCGLDIGGTGFLTTYQYDPLGNLIQVNQNGMNARTFTYDSLSHLKSATNPESGTISYAYDDAGNLHTKTGSKQNQTNPAVTVTTTYQYDALNRPMSKAYDDGSTPSANWIYDQASATTGQSLANSIGRLTTVNAAGGLSLNLYSYDSMGRVASNWQCTPAQICSSSMKQLVYNYDMLGDITSASNGFGVNIGYQFNTAARLLSVTSNLSDSTHPANLMSNITYGAFGPVSASFGNGVTETRGYTSRGQVNLISDTVVITQPAVPGSGSVTVSGSERTIGGPPATAAAGSVTLAGSIQSTQVVNQPAAPGSGTVNISGSEQSTQAQSSPGTPGQNGSVSVSGTALRAYDDSCTCYVYDSGTISVTVGSYTTTVPYSQATSATSIAASIASNLSLSSIVTASSSGGTVVTITSKTNGANTNYAVSASETSNRPDLFPSGSFSLSTANLSGGTNPTYYTLYDSGTVTATVGGFSKSTSYGQGSNTSSVASALASAFNGDGNSPVTASASGASLNLTSKATGANTNYSLSASSSTSQGSYFSQPSFSASATSSTLLGGHDATYNTLYDSGTVSITANGVTKSTSYGQNSTLSGLASSLASAFNGDSGAPVTASTSGATVNLTTKATGAGTNYSLSTSSSTSQSAYFSHPSFSGSASGSTLTGGQDAGANINDAGTLSISVNGFTKSASYGQTSTASSIASALVSALNADSSSPVNTSVSGATVTLTAKAGGAATNYALSASSATNQSGFTGTSFPASASGANLAGGVDSSQTPTTPYSVSLTFTPNGNVATANDNVNSNWVYKYDDFNRLSCSNLASNGTCAAPTNGTPTYTYDYDRFGNRWHQNGPWRSQLGFDANNRISGVPGVGYDAAGNVTSDGSGLGTHQYFYDAENRIIQVDGTLGNCSTATACYVYDGDGRRIRKTVSGTSTDFLYDSSNRVVAEMSSTGVWNRGEIFAAGQHIATYNNSTTYFTHSDWLGTERARTQVRGSVCETTASLPFGDGASTNGSCQPSPNLFTGKERDSESGLDNFGGRYDASSFGRFMSPDWSPTPEPVPFADLDDPQSLNLYAYVKNNPINRIDAGGHQGKESLAGTNYTILKHKENPNDMPNIHVYDKSGNEAGQLRFNGRGESRWEGAKNLSSEVKLQVEGIARAEGYAARAVERQLAMNATRAARGSGTASRALSWMIVVDMILNAIYVHQTEKNEGTTGWHYDALRDTNVITDVEKAAKSFAVGSSVTTGSELTHDLDTYTLGSDGKWRDSQGNTLFNCDVDGKSGVCTTKGMA
jgi:RHS repeat-associated protein